MILLQMPSTHMIQTAESNGIDFSDFLLGAFFIITFFLILFTIILLFVFKNQIREKLSKKIDFDEPSNLTNLSEKSIENNPEFKNHILENESVTDENYMISYSIDDQAYQRERLMNLINNFPDGVLQSKLPNLTNLSKATVSRRISELVQNELILREPKGRSILIIPKNS
ncbi:MAG: hypothetical protein HeimC3_20320 [Candidatus Heimdallarchaeota archaeon LC_3]|nr:MAG: hypothetical protein HeimC3_20320 [Candidatus Heimdallarchaeota archaeon LC_3]